jgi:bacterial/archaeal transporter family-2 protein
METLALPFLLLVGGLLAVQAAANVQLSTAMTSPFGASALQLGIGAALLVTLAAVAGTLGAVELLGEAEPWTLAGGLGSALYITAGILLFPRVGALVAVGLFIAGQMLASLLLDGFGWLGVPQEPLGAAALLGAAAVVAGAWLIVRAQRAPVSSAEPERASGGPPARADGAPARRVDRVPPLSIALGLLAGAVLPVQGAINAQLRADLDASITVGAFSFVVATGAMALVLGLSGAPRPRVAPLRDVPWWGWLGGACGATYVTSVFLLIPEIGAAPTIALTVAGQQLASVLVDRHGLLRLPRRAITPRRLAGVTVLLAGVALIQLP